MPADSTQQSAAGAGLVAQRSVARAIEVMCKEFHITMAPAGVNAVGEIERQTIAV
jgi:isopentenyl diphosphate isomerase/L-lactate dehydrogenase-like FMN-dependent dehydrogenase